MNYSIDLRRRVVEFVKKGGSKAEAAWIFNISRVTIYDWLRRSDLAPKARGPCDRKLKKNELVDHVKAYPDAFLRKRAAHFGVRTSTVWAALQKLNICKKNDALLWEKSQQKSALSARSTLSYAEVWQGEHCIFWWKWLWGSSCSFIWLGSKRKEDLRRYLWE